MGANFLTTKEGQSDLAFSVKGKHVIGLLRAMNIYVRYRTAQYVIKTLWLCTTGLCRWARALLSLNARVDRRVAGTCDARPVRRDADAGSGRDVGAGADADADAGADEDADGAGCGYG